MNTTIVVRACGAALVIAAAAGLSACSAEAPKDSEPAVTLTDASSADGTAIKTVQLSEHAVQRLGIATGTVHQATQTVAGVSGQHKVVPYAAVVYDSDGSTWTYVSVSPRTYARARITVTAIQGDVAVLTDGPDDGAVVVTQGAPELQGAEAEIAGEE
jgi:hypothetical protein